MLDKLENLFFGFFDLLDNGWNYLTADLIKKYEFNYKEAVLNHVKFFETKMKQYNPITVFIGAIVMLMTILYVMKMLRRFWKKISKDKPFLINFCLFDYKNKKLNSSSYSF